MYINNPPPTKRVRNTNKSLIIVGSMSKCSARPPHTPQSFLFILERYNFFMVFYFLFVQIYRKFFCCIFAKVKFCKIFMEKRSLVFRKPTLEEVDNIVEIIKYAVKRLGDTGISQWQNGYPNKEVVLQDIENGVARVLCEKEKILAYGALVFTGEKAYDDLKGGEWILQTQNYATIHRACVSNSCLGEGYGKLFMIFAENEAKQTSDSIRIDTHPDNKIMQGLVASLHYEYCGKVMYESVRLAYEKVLK